MRIDFYQEVKIIRGKNTKKKRKYVRYIGCKGVVMGISEEDDVIYGYSVRIHREDRSRAFDPDEVIPTGVRFKHEDFYNGSRARVSADGELLEATIVDEPGAPPRREIKFVAQEDYDPERALPEGPNGGYWDRFDNEWVKVPAITEGEEFEWEVILSSKGQQQYELYPEQILVTREHNPEHSTSQKTDAKFTFYQEVKVRPEEHLKHSNAVGVIFAIGDDEGSGYSYAVHLPSHEHKLTISCWESDLEGTGNFFRREDFFDSFQVRMRLSINGELLEVYRVET